MSDLSKLASDLRSLNVAKVCGPVMSRAGGNMQRAAREAAPTGQHIPGYARTIVFEKDGPLAVEVGAMAVGQGNLSAVLEYGQGANAPHPHIVPQLEPEADVTAEWLGKVIAEAFG